MPLTLEQQRAVDEFCDGKNVRVRAVPGAGKSRVLVETCRRAPGGQSIILAYNHDLCKQTRAKLEEATMTDRVSCYTFHGLCCACLAPAYDDQQLYDAVDAAERGDLVVKRVDVQRVLVDEAQDFKHIFHRLLTLILNVNDSTQYMIVGDPMQMLYDYDEEDPANLKYLDTPAMYFVSGLAWSVVDFTVSHRITPQMAALVSVMFATNITSASTCACPVNVRTVNMWKAGNLIHEILLQHPVLHEVVLLTETKRNNGPLRAAVNHLSTKGIKIHIQGVDGQDERVRRNKLSVSSWHASKGTEKRVVIVFGLRGDCKRNPSFVAMTRSFERLYVIQDENCLHAGLMHAVHHLSTSALCVDTTTRTLSVQFASIDTPPCDPRRPFRSSGKCLDSWQPSGSGRWLRPHVQCTLVNQEPPREDNDGAVVALPNGLHEATDAIYSSAIRLKLEWLYTSNLKAANDVVQPKRMDFAQKMEAMRHGDDSRIVSRTMPDIFLLPPDLRGLMQRALLRKESAADWITIATAVASWNNFHHTMRQLFPLNWIDETVLDYGLNIAKDALGDSGERVAFDVMLLRREAASSETFLYARCHACSNRYIWHFVFVDTVTQAHRNEAAVRAALDEQRRPVMLVNTKTGAVAKIEVSDAGAILARILG